MNKILKMSLRCFCLGIICLTNSHTGTSQGISSKTLTYRQIFPRNQGYETRMLVALGAWVHRMPTPLVQALGPLSLKAAEMEYSSNGTITPDQVITEIGDVKSERRRGFVNGVLAGLIMVECGKRSFEPQTIVLKQWATSLYRSIKVRSAKSVVDEFVKWKNNPCVYKAIGYTRPPDCGLGALNKMGLYASLSPPQDIIVKAGLNSIFGSGADKVAEVAALGAYALTLGVSAAMISSTLGLTYTFVTASASTGSI